MCDIYISRFCIEPVGTHGWVELDPVWHAGVHHSRQSHTAHARRIPLLQVQLEQDTGKSVDLGDADARGCAGPCVGVDLNRCGAPLVELVTAPQLFSADEAITCARVLADLLRSLGTSSASFEDGSIRVDVNLSMHPRLSDPATSADEVVMRMPDGTALGPGYGRVELKNVHSFKFIQSALHLEMARLRDHWSRGDPAPEPCTRGYDAGTQRTVHLRTKETSRDYMFMPDPDLPRVVFTPAFLQAVACQLSASPLEHCRRLLARHGQGPDGVDVRTLCRLRDAGPQWLDLFEQACQIPTDSRLRPPAHGDTQCGTGSVRSPRQVANWILNTVFAELHPTPQSSQDPVTADFDTRRPIPGGLTAARLASVVDVVSGGWMPSHLARRHLQRWLRVEEGRIEEGTMDTLVDQWTRERNEGRTVFSVAELMEQLQQVLETDPRAKKALEECRLRPAKKFTAITYLAGGVMRRCHGQCRHHDLREALRLGLQERHVPREALARWEATQTTTPTKQK